MLKLAWLLAWNHGRTGKVTYRIVMLGHDALQCHARASEDNQRVCIVCACHSPTLLSRLNTAQSLGPGHAVTGALACLSTCMKIWPARQESYWLLIGLYTSMLDYGACKHTYTNWGTDCVHGQDYYHIHCHLQTVAFVRKGFQAPIRIHTIALRCLGPGPPSGTWHQMPSMNTNRH